MSIKAKISKRKGLEGQGLVRLRRYLRNLSFHNVDTGFFAESGVHPSIRNTEKWTYAQLMGFHELQVNFTDRRPIFSIASKKLVKDIPVYLLPTLLKSLDNAVKGRSTNPDDVLNKGGLIMRDAILEVFGKTPPLAANTDSTVKRKGFQSPMIETGALQDAVSYRNSRDKKVKS